MALGTPVISHRDNEGDDVTIVGQVPLTSGANYTTGGSQLTAAQLGLNYIRSIRIDNLTQDGATLVSIGDRSGLAVGPVTSVLLKAFSALNTEVTSNTNLSAAGKTVGFEVTGY
jgi:hypothetical protein